MSTKTQFHETPEGLWLWRVYDVHIDPHSKKEVEGKSITSEKTFHSEAEASEDMAHWSKSTGPYLGRVPDA